MQSPALSLITSTLAQVLNPGEPITPSVWAAQNLVVPDGPYAGEKFNRELTPYLVEPLDCFADDVAVNKLSIRKSAQTGFTLLAIAAIGYSIAREPARLMVVQPTDSALSEFNREKLQPSIDGSKALRAKVKSQTSRSSSGSTTYSKRFPGGSLTLAIATSTADLRGKTIKKVIRDEASDYPVDLDGQGSPHDMIEARYESFLAAGSWKDFAISTPVVKGACYIDAEFEAGDQRFWNVPCPGCGTEFVFERGDGFKHSRERPYQAHYIAPCCGRRIEGHEKNGLIRKGRWVARSPSDGKARSYHFDALSSPFVPWDTIAERVIRAETDPIRLKALDNLTFGVPHEVKGDAPDHVRLMALREQYQRRRIPPQGLIVVASADIQANAIYVLVEAMAPDRQSWVIEALTLDGDTSDPSGGAFAKLIDVYETEWPDSYGGSRRADAFGVDSGFRSNVVYTWCRGRPRSFSLKGGDGWARPPISSPSLVDIDLQGKRIKQGASVWTVGTWSLKAQIYSDLRKLRMAEGAESEPAGAMHHGDWLEENFFTQLTNEHLVDDRSRGKMRRVWKERGANHFLDCAVYNRALADYLGLSRMTGDEWKSLAKMRNVPEGAPLLVVEPEKPKTIARPVMQRRSTPSSFM